MEAQVLNQRGEIRLKGLTNFGYRDFSGKNSLNGAWDGTIVVQIDDPAVQELLEEYNYPLKFPDLKDRPDNVAYPTISVKIRYVSPRTNTPVKRPPEIRLIQFDENNEVVANTLIDDAHRDKLDTADIRYIDMDIRHWEYEPGKYSVYLVKMAVIANIDYYEERYRVTRRDEEERAFM